MEELHRIYDRFAEKYEHNREHFDTEFIFNHFFKSLNLKQGKLLDLGCGAGYPVSALFSHQGWDVTGVDFSEKMLALAKKNVPALKTIHADIQLVEFEQAMFDAVVASYSLFHIPMDKHTYLFEKIYSWLVDQGKFLFTYATREYTGNENFSGYKEFLGETLFYSHTTPEALKKILEDIGFTIERFEYNTIQDETFLWVTVQK
jgi:cyclopropane fatty-acyl-phospholipid synthase-like methyltransferase